MNILERKHLPELLLALGIKSAGDFLLRILERAEHPIENREIRVVIRVALILMMNAVRFRTLDEPAQPVRRANVPMIDVFRHTGEQRVIGGGRDTAPEQGINDGGAEQRVESDLDRVLVKAGHYLNALG